MGNHYLGKRINGNLARFHGSISDSDFAEIANRGLPIGWVAWHVEDSENRHNSPRVAEFARRPLIGRNFDDLIAMNVDTDADAIELPHPLASWRSEMESEVARAGVAAGGAHCGDRDPMTSA